jgi:hypothetical protein
LAFMSRRAPLVAATSSLILRGWAMLAEANSAVR